MESVNRVRSWSKGKPPQSKPGVADLTLKDDAAAPPASYLSPKVKAATKPNMARRMSTGIKNEMGGRLQAIRTKSGFLSDRGSKVIPNDSDKAWVPVPSDKIVHEGYLYKRSGGYNKLSVGALLKNWKLDYFCLTSDTLLYFENQEAMNNGQPPLGALALDRFSHRCVEIIDDKLVVFVLANVTRDLTIRVESVEQYHQWLMHLKAIHGYSEAPNSPEDQRTLQSQVRQTVLGSSKPTTTATVAMTDMRTFFTDWASKHTSSSNDTSYWLVEKMHSTVQHHPRYLVVSGGCVLMMNPKTQQLTKMMHIQHLVECAYELDFSVLRLRFSDGYIAFFMMVRQSVLQEVLQVLQAAHKHESDTPLVIKKVRVFKNSAGSKDRGQSDNPGGVVSVASMLRSPMLAPLWEVLRTEGFEEEAVWEGDADPLATMDCVRRLAKTNPTVRRHAHMMCGGHNRSLREHAAGPAGEASEGGQEWIVEFLLPSRDELRGATSKHVRVDRHAKLYKIVHGLCTKIRVSNPGHFAVHTLRGRLLSSDRTLADYGLGTLFRAWRLRLCVVPSPLAVTREVARAAVEDMVCAAMQLSHERRREQKRQMCREVLQACVRQVEEQREGHVDLFNKVIPSLSSAHQSAISQLIHEYMAQHQLLSSTTNAPSQPATQNTAPSAPAPPVPPPPPLAPPPPSSKLAEPVKMVPIAHIKAKSQEELIESRFAKAGSRSSGRMEDSLVAKLRFKRANLRQANKHVNSIASEIEEDFFAALGAKVKEKVSAMREHLHDEDESDESSDHGYFSD